MAGSRITTASTIPRDDLLGLYGPGSEAWAFNREAMLLLGAGPRALLLQLAHPQVAAGVADHSDFRSDPWARLRGTLRSYLRIVYGTGTAARAEIRRLNGLHRTITGPTYRARDPELSLWVHA
ncbi:MAG TPA: oxygenase MpaB family protein, partial [Candidatus Limnocylindrales bacterium]